jgi:hypothetical protein
LVASCFKMADWFINRPTTSVRLSWSLYTSLVSVINRHLRVLPRQCAVRLTCQLYWQNEQPNRNSNDQFTNFDLKSNPSTLLLSSSPMSNDATLKSMWKNNITTKMMSLNLITVIRVHRPVNNLLHFQPSEYSGRQY